MKRRRFKVAIVGPLVIVLLILFSLGIFAVMGIKIGSGSSRQRMIESNRTMLSISTRLLFNPLYDLDVWTLNNVLAELVGNANIVRAVVRDVDGQIVSENTGEECPRDKFGDLEQDLAAQSLAQHGIVQREIEDYLVLCGPIAVGAEQIGTLEIVYDLSFWVASLMPMIVVMTLVTFLLLVLSLAVVGVIAHKIRESLGGLVVVAEEIGRGNLDTPVPVRGSEETAMLGVALEHMRVELRRLYAGLEHQVADLELRANYLETTARVARDAASVLDLQDLLSRVVASVSEQLGFYHSGVFLLDQDGEWVVLQAASSEGGRRMLERAHRLRFEDDNLVTRVIRSGRPAVALDVGDDAVSFHNSDLPETRSQVVLPLLARGEIIGALDVQSVEAEAFSDEQVAVLQTLADQVATAISNARLFQQVQENLEAERRAYGELGREVWAKFVRSRAYLGYRYDKNGVVPLTSRVEPAEKDEAQLPEVSLPLEMRGRVVATLKAHKPDAAGDWTPEERTLLEVLVAQVSVALESARLYQDTQIRAAREQMIGEVTAQVRETLDVETVIKTAVREVRQALNLPQVVIRLASRLGEEEKAERQPWVSNP